MLNPNLKRTGAAAAIATALAVPAEGVRQWAYYDPPGVLTVCAGHTGRDIDPHHKYSLDECKAFLTVDMQRAVAQVSHCAPTAPVEVLAAFSDAVFNLGRTLACDQLHSTAARMLYLHNWRGACEQLPLWNKAHVAGMLITLPGLTTRRQRELGVCLQGVA